QARRSRLAIVLITVASSVWHVVVLSSTHCLQRVAYRLTPDGLTIDLCQDKRKFSGLRNDLVMMSVPSPHTPHTLHTLHTLRTLRALQTGPMYGSTSPLTRAYRRPVISLARITAWLCSRLRAPYSSTSLRGPACSN